MGHCTAFFFYDLAVPQLNVDLLCLNFSYHLTLVDSLDTLMVSFNFPSISVSAL